MLAFREKLLSSEIDALKRKLSDYNFDETKSGNVVARRVGGHEHEVCPGRMGVHSGVWLTPNRTKRAKRTIASIYVERRFPCFSVKS